MSYLTFSKNIDCIFGFIWIIRLSFLIKNIYFIENNKTRDAMFASILKSYAKINIGLRILKKRPDGYHDLETIFYPIKLHDELPIRIEPSSSDFNSVIMTSNKSFIPLNKDNLCYKAVEKFFKAFKIKNYYKITLHIKKLIPVGGGLGGGSSNAASVIKFLIKYFNIDIEANKKAILKLALSIGSDVPFFLMHKPCYAEGRGEIMEILREFNIDYNILIVNPNLHISTRWAFEKLNVNMTVKEQVLNTQKIFNPCLKDIFVNDFEQIIFQRHLLLKDIKDELLKTGAVFSSMSGSGATMYGFFNKNDKAALIKCRNLYSSKNFFTYISAAD